MPGKKRLDAYLFESGLAQSREKAKALIIAGAVSVNEKRCCKPSTLLNGAEKIEVKAADGYVSRGGKKLEKALETFGIDLNGAAAVDVGASTGGFTDCMLRHGAARVYAVDVGHGQLAWSLRNDDRVTVMERVNARDLTPRMFAEDINFASVDVSFISLKAVLPAVAGVLKPPFGIVALIKPQFEAGRDKVGKRGVVRDKETHIGVIKSVLGFARGIGLSCRGVTYSPIKGPEGNIEYLAYFRDCGADAEIDIGSVAEEAHGNLR